MQNIIRTAYTDGLIESIAALLSDKPNPKVFLVSGGPFAEPLITGLTNRGVKVTVFSEFSPNPLYEDVVAGLAAYKKSQADLLVSIGGGSAIDTAKCILLFSTVDAGDNYLNAEYKEPSIPHLAIPTTAGTGSEATTFAVVYFEGEKYSVDSPGALPNHIAFVPDYLRGLPLYHKRATFLDALCQAIESLWSVNSTDESKDYARKAIGLITDIYPAYFETDDDSIIEAALEAAYRAGQAINISKTTAAHAMSYQMSSLYGLAHGHAASLCLPKVWRYMVNNLELCNDPRGVDYLEGVFAEIDGLLGFQSHFETIAWFEALLLEMDMLPPTSVNAGDVEVLAKSVNAQRLGNNPIPLSEVVILGLYQEIVPALKHVS
ncbi:MAG: phosphonoacetaldehyde reductase [Coriobacteriia bacterium]|nr:phosphonoacetaldehyde reductase [Coriobacteriia bacterium]